MLSELFGTFGRPSVAVTRDDVSALTAVAAARDVAVSLVYSVRARDLAAFDDVFRQWAEHLPFFSYTLHVSAESGSRVVDAGLVLDPALTGTSAAAAGASTSSAGVGDSVHAFLCGPAGFDTAVSAALTAQGVSPANIHTESFAY